MQWCLIEGVVSMRCQLTRLKTKGLMPQLAQLKTTRFTYENLSPSSSIGNSHANYAPIYNPYQNLLTMVGQFK